jgi:HAD superfamily hydrolase (TIGR01509 family)
MRLIIFDFDGIILDTETPDHTTWRELYAEYGVDLPLDAWAYGIGAPSAVFDPLLHLEKLLGRELDRETIRLRCRKRFHALLAEQPLCAGVADYLRDASGQELLLAVASSATRDWVEGHLNRFGVANAFACIRCVEDVAHGKPAPDLFHAVLRDLDVPPHEAIVLEDSPNGVLAANRAGIYCVAVPNPVTRHLNLDHADLRIESLTEWPLDRLLAYVRSGASDRHARAQGTLDAMDKR